jgi:hypothetical protein
VVGPGWLLGRFKGLAERLTCGISGRPTRSAGRPTSSLAPAHFGAGASIVAGSLRHPPGFAV